MHKQDLRDSVRLFVPDEGILYSESVEQILFVEYVKKFPFVQFKTLMSFLGKVWL